MSAIVFVSYKYSNVLYSILSYVINAECSQGDFLSSRRAISSLLLSVAPFKDTYEYNLKI